MTMTMMLMLMMMINIVFITAFFEPHGGALQSVFRVFLGQRPQIADFLQQFGIEPRCVGVARKQMPPQEPRELELQHRHFLPLRQLLTVRREEADERQEDDGGVVDAHLGHATGEPPIRFSQVGRQEGADLLAIHANLFSHLKARR